MYYFNIWVAAVESARGSTTNLFWKHLLYDFERLCLLFKTILFRGFYRYSSFFLV